MSKSVLDRLILSNSLHEHSSPLVALQPTAIRGWSNAPPSGAILAKRQDNLPELCTWKNNNSDSKSKRYKFALKRT